MSVVAKEGQQEIQRVQLSQTFDAPIAHVYQAWTQPTAFREWFGPPSMEKQSLEMDLRVGGTWKMVAKSKESDAITTMFGTYQEVVPYQKLVFTWNLDTLHVKDTMVTVTFRDLGNATEVMLIHERFVDLAMVEPHGQGWKDGLKRLQAYLKTV